MLIRKTVKFLSVILVFALTVSNFMLFSAEDSGMDYNSLYNIGCGIYDITGPVAEVVTMGYGDLGLQTQGLHTRLRSRAFIFENPNSSKRIVFVSADLGQLFQSIKQGVIKKLKAKYGSLYDDSNVMLSATHTHSGPGGYSHYALYNLSCKGFIEQNYNCIVEGIYQSIVNAHDNMEPGYIYMKTGLVEGISVNRS